MRTAALFFLVIVTGCATSAGDGANSTGGAKKSYSAKGQASYYADSLQGRKTASGESYDKKKLTAAHRELAFGTKVRVTNLANNETVTVRVNDRGPFAKERIIDVSRKAAETLDFVRQGHTDVRIEVID
ncbi:MAG: septal ring lytic transglycosylase RlpA family protein [Myxococcales bacterium]|jgi:rare lipoprotein A|nr:MAG: septal ring lytic transglycosylase RlpA family protein [Myxococcales bacterium]